MFTRLWFRRVAERAVMTFAQTGAAMITGNHAELLALDTLTILKLAGMAALGSVLTSIIKSKLTGDPENPGLE